MNVVGHSLHLQTESDFRPPAPEPREKVPGLIPLLGALRRNPLELWSLPHFTKPAVRHSFAIADMIVMSDPAGIRRVLVENTQNYRKDKLQKLVMGDALGKGLLMTEGESWRMQRRGLAQLFSRRMVTSFAPAMSAAADDLVRRWHGSTGRVLVGDEAGRLTMDVLLRTIFSDGLGDEPEAMRHALGVYFDHVGKIDPFDFLGLPTWVPRPLKWKVRDTLSYFDRTIDHLIERRRSLLDRGLEAPPDILTALLTLRDSENGSSLTPDEVRSNILTFIAAGLETTANTISWTLFLLSRSPAWAGIVRREAEETADVQPDDLFDHLPVTRAVIEEALRLYPPIVAISRVAVDADEVAGEEIRPGTMVIVSPYVLHRHRSLWDRPDVFDPSRFMGARRTKLDKFAWLPFGVGPRICIGAAFAQQEAAVVVSRVLRHFTLEPDPVIDVLPVQRVTLKPSHGLPLILRPL